MTKLAPRRAEILSTRTPELFRAAVARAVELLTQGELVALPTETVYGLAANALDAAAVARIFEAKGRPSHNPIIVHVSSVKMARQCVSQWPPLAQQLARAFWPGPLTLVLPRSKKIPDLVTAGGPTVGVRWPNHPFIQAVIRACDFPLAAPSANLSNRISPTTAAHVASSLGRRVPLIVDGGPSQVGIESTVLDLTATQPRVLRPGMIHEVALSAVLGARASNAPAHPKRISVDQPPLSGQTLLRSPGLLEKHYAPKAKLVEWSWRDDEDLARQMGVLPHGPDRIHIIAHHRIPTRIKAGQLWILPHDPEAFARSLYSTFHGCDDREAEWIVVEALPKTVAWHGLADRLRRAAGKAG